MKRDSLYALVNIGLQSIELIIGEIVRKKRIIPVEYLWKPSSIGYDISSKNQISSQSIQETMHVIKNYIETIHSYQIKNFRILISNTIQEASNCDVLLERIFRICKTKPEIIDPIEKLELFRKGIKALIKDKYGFDKKNIVFFSLCADSTHIILQFKGKIIFSETNHTGILNTSMEYSSLDEPYQLALNPISISFNKTIQRFSEIKKINGFIGISDDILPLIQRDFSDKLAKHFFKIPRKSFNKFFSQIEKTSIEKLKDKHQLSESLSKRAKITAILFGMFFNLTSSKYILFPEYNSSYFLLYKFSSNNTRVIEREIEENIISSALAIGKKYQYDREHSLYVHRLSLMLFDDLKKYYELSNRERIYLQVAAILHDIGFFISASSHHKHSAQLIKSSEIIGLHKNEMKIIAQIARYHRKSLPKPTHTEYIEMPLEDRITISRLAGILRIADAMDNSHLQIVERANLSINGNNCEIYVKIKNNRDDFMEIIRHSIKKKSELFENFFGVSLTLEKSL